VIRPRSSRLRLAVTAVLVVPAVAASTFLAFASDTQSSPKENGISSEARALVRQAISSTGLISIRLANDSAGQQPRPRGSAVIVRSDGIVVTNNHVITNTRTGRPYDEIYLSLSTDGETVSQTSRYRIKTVLINKDYDLALLRVDADANGKSLSPSFTFPTIELGDSRKIKLLEDLFIIGFPEKGGATITVNRGVVEGKDILSSWIKTDARLIHGNSGGAAVNSEGRLIGIPTKVVADEQPIDRDGDGFPDDSKRYGAVGFLRPAHLVAEMIAQLDDDKRPPSGMRSMPEPLASVTVRGVVKSASSGKPIAGALVGLVALGETAVTESNLLTWGSTNGDGAFKLNKPVPPGKYTIKAKAIGNEPFSGDVEIGPSTPALLIEMISAPPR
jgi:S1-C subfamily serine protease